MGKREELEKKRKELKLMTTTEFAGVTQKTIQTVDRWISDGILITKVLDGKKFIVPFNSILNLYQYYEKKANGKEENKDKVELQTQLLKATIDNKKKDLRRKDVMIELQELKRDIQSGKYIQTDKVIEANGKFLTIFRNFALSIPSQLIGMIAHKLDKGTVREVQANLENQVKKLLTNFVDNGRLEEEQNEVGKIELNEKGEETKKRGRKKK